MAVVSTRAGRLGNRVAVAAVIVITLIFLSPIYWITSTAFKPLVLSTSVPPTVVFEPQITPFVKLFTKRAQPTEPVDQATYDAAPWWEKLVLDGGERLARDGLGECAVLGVSGPVHQFADHRDHLDDSGGFAWDDHGVRLLALPCEG